MPLLYFFLMQGKLRKCFAGLAPWTPEYRRRVIEGSVVLVERVMGKRRVLFICELTMTDKAPFIVWCGKYK